MENFQNYLDPRVLNKVARLELRARLIVEGFIAGLHKSPYRGVSVEFAAHREYTPGDDLRHLDWKIFGRSDRLYIKEYEQETNLYCHIMLDTSESMDYASGEISKFEYGRSLAAALAYLVVQQQDAVALELFDREIYKAIPPSSNPAHLNAIFKELSEVKPTRKTDVKAISMDMTERVRKRGLVIIISDLFDDPNAILKGLQRLRFKGQEIIIFHLLDEAEMSFPFDWMTRFIGLEEYPDVVTDPRHLRREYINIVQNFITTLRRGCLKERIDYVQISTDQMLDVALSAYLATRLATHKAKK
ncbi:MAG: DUF58 domain-containing protein [Planctomycetes bacterium]|nr:DUF58 domain-containing protein [Planctomycetota bacterium]